MVGLIMVLDLGDRTYDEVRTTEFKKLPELTNMNKK